VSFNFSLEGFLCLFCGEKIEKGNISAIMGRYKKHNEIGILCIS
jgi:hypothetical protein